MSLPDLHRFSIGWICALPIEAAAATLMLDESFESLTNQDESDFNAYTLGRIHHHYVVIACLPYGQYGTTSAAQVAIHMTRTFSASLRIGLLVGIGAGVPTQEHDVRLGDVVIGCPTDVIPGVVQHDFRKDKPDGTSRRIGALNKPPKILLTALSNLRRDAFIRTPTFLTYIRDAVAMNPHAQKTFQRPDIRTDRLFSADCGHVPYDMTCESCPSSGLILRNERSSVNPEVHYGIIASGNTVVKSAHHRDSIAAETKAICIEMEAAGLVDEFPCLVIRGICDYADSHKTRQWQSYAALVAAASAKELLQYVPVLQEGSVSLAADLCDIFTKGLTQISRGQKRSLEAIEELTRSQKRQKASEDEISILQALKTSLYREQKDLNALRAPGTCEWVVKSYLYKKWVSCTDPGATLWIFADPGCGKSVLARYLVDAGLHATKANAPIICYYFFKDYDGQNSLATALCAVLHQIFAMNRKLIHHALGPWRIHGSSLCGDLQELWSILIKISEESEIPEIVCLLDAMDECLPQDQSRFFDLMRNSNFRMSKSSLRILVTSRPYGAIVELSKSLSEHMQTWRLEDRHADQQRQHEINSFIIMKMRQLASDLSLSDDLCESIKDKLFSVRNRTYLWLYLVLEDIRKTLGNSLRPSLSDIRWIPPTLEAAYMQLLRRVPEEQSPFVRKILQILVVARRPLDVLELSFALGLVYTPRGDSLLSIQLNTITLPRRLRELCGLFVIFEGSRASLFHHTAKETLLCCQQSIEQNPHLWRFTVYDAEETMASVCLSYLTLLRNNYTQVSMRRLLIGRTETYAFAVYASTYWSEHYKQCSEFSRRRLQPLLSTIFNHAKVFQLLVNIVGIVKLKCIDFERKKSVTFRAYVEYASNHGKKQWDTSPSIWRATMFYALKLSPAALMAFLGVRNALQQEVRKQAAELASLDSNGWSLMEYALHGGHLDLADDLLVWSRGLSGFNLNNGRALRLAAARGDLPVMKWLLHHGICADAIGKHHCTALQAATIAGHNSAVDLLLSAGADFKRTFRCKVASATGFATSGLTSALHSSIVCRQERIASDLLRRGARPIARQLLEIAIRRGDLGLLQLLLASGAEIDAVNEDDSALNIAALLGNLKAIKILVDQGADVHTLRGSYGSPLIAAAHGGNLDVIAFLIGQEVDVHMSADVCLINWDDTEFRESGTALYFAANAGHLDVVKLLVSKGAEVNVTSGCGISPLHAAIKQSHLLIIEYLLQNAATITNSMYHDAREEYIKATLILDPGSTLEIDGSHDHQKLYETRYEAYHDIIPI